MAEVPLLRSIPRMRAWSADTRAAKRTIGFVPTMGALHDGHLALVAASKKRCDRTVVSVFVNPAQFGPGEDYTGYPRTLAADRRRCADAGVDVVFAPSARAMYPRKPETRVAVPALSTVLCGASRPGHFDGVCLVVAKLLHAVTPDVLFLGRKDAQQAAILRRMVDDLDLPVRVAVRPIVRERDGLALSSRNRYLSPDERAYAPTLYRALRDGASAIRAGERDAAAVRRVMRRALGRRAFTRVEYADVVDPDTLRPVREVERKVLLALAVHVGRARLIDNLVARPPARRVSRGGRPR